MDDFESGLGVLAGVDLTQGQVEFDLDLKAYTGVKFELKRLLKKLKKNNRDHHTAELVIGPQINCGIVDDTFNLGPTLRVSINHTEIFFDFDIISTAPGRPNNGLPQRFQLGITTTPFSN